MHHEQDSSSSHEHPWRGRVDRALYPLAEKLHKILGLTPNQITLLGGALVAISAAIPVIRGLQGTRMRNRDEKVLQANKTSIIPDVDGELLVEQESEDDTLLMLAATVVYVLGVSMDKLDGVMASYFAKQQLQHDSELGGVLDTISDRFQEFAVSLSKINTSHQRGDALGKILALLNGISSMLPSFFRALAESQGKSVKEAGRNIGMLGTRPTRAAMALTAFYPHIGRLPLQQILDGIGTLSNVITAYQRAQVCSEAPHLTEQMDQDSSDSDRAKMREKGRLKLRYQTPVAIMCIAMLLAEYNRLNNNN